MPLHSGTKVWRYPDIESMRTSGWSQFFREFEEHPNVPVSFSLVDTFLTLAYSSWLVPWNELFLSGLFRDLVESIAVIAHETTRDRDLAPYVWALSLFVGAGHEFLAHFEDERLISTLVDVSCSNFQTSSCHALRSLMDMCTYDADLVGRISRHLERLIVYFNSIPDLHHRKFMCLVLIATIAPETDQWQGIGNILANGLVFGKLEERIMYLSAMNAFVRMPKCLEHISLINSVVTVLPKCIRDTRVDATTESLMLTYELLEGFPGLQMPFRAIIDSIATSAQTDREHTVLGFKILGILVERHIEIEYIVSLRRIMEPAVRFLERSSYATKIAALEFLASILVYGDHSQLERAAQLDPFQYCSDIVTEKQASAIIFQAILILTETQHYQHVVHLLPDLELVARDHEHPHRLLASRVISYLPL